MAELEDRLKAGIVTALGWDAFVAEGVVTAIAEAGTRAGEYAQLCGVPVAHIPRLYGGGAALWRKRTTSYTLAPATAMCDVGYPCAGSQREVDDIVTDYLGGGKQVS